MRRRLVCLSVQSTNEFLESDLHGLLTQLDSLGRSSKQLAVEHCLKAKNLPCEMSESPHSTLSPDFRQDSEVGRKSKSDGNQIWVSLCRAEYADF